MLRNLFIIFIIITLGSCRYPTVDNPTLYWQIVDASFSFVTEENGKYKLDVLGAYVKVINDDGVSIDIPVSAAHCADPSLLSDPNGIGNNGEQFLVLNFRPGDNGILKPEELPLYEEEKNHYRFDFLRVGYSFAKDKFDKDTGVISSSKFKQNTNRYTEGTDLVAFTNKLLRKSVDNEFIAELHDKTTPSSIPLLEGNPDYDMPFYTIDNLFGIPALIQIRCTENAPLNLYSDIRTIVVSGHNELEVANFKDRDEDNIVCYGEPTEIQQGKSGSLIVTLIEEQPYAVSVFTGKIPGSTTFTILHPKVFRGLLKHYANNYDTMELSTSSSRYATVESKY